ncbi:MAG: MBL fold metallo-hydrolase [Planctomycetota bacterium]
MKLGNFDIFPVSDGFFKLDGGAMFGVVPKVLWEKRMPPDQDNRIQMGLFCLLIKASGKNIVVNTGIGAKYSPRYHEIFRIQHPPELISSLAEHKVSPDDVDFVINTHLHFDHTGNNTKKVDDNIYAPTFPNARYIIQKAEWEKATNPNERTRASYMQENIRPLMDAKRLDLREGSGEVVPGVMVYVTGGHTRGHQVVLMESQGQKAVYWSDLMPTVAHLDLPYIMGYDLFPEETLNHKRILIEQAVKERWLCFWEHDPKITCGYIERTEKGLVVKPI